MNLVVLINAQTQDLSAEESSRPLLKPSGKPLTVRDEPKPQVTYISADDDQRPAIDYISTPTEESSAVQVPRVEYINSRPLTYEYIRSYPNYGYNTYLYSQFPRYSYQSKLKNYQDTFRLIFLVLNSHKTSYSMGY